jgi:hypothetical protein
MTLYVPGPVLVWGKNDIVLLEMEEVPAQTKGRGRLGKGYVTIILSCFLCPF